MTARKPIKPLLGAIGALALSIALSGCSGSNANENETAEPEIPLPVMVVPVEITDIHASYKTTANLVADAEAPVLARARGEVVELLVEEGDRVHQGQVLARLDGDRLRLEMRRARTEFEKASGEFARMKNLHERSLISTATVDDLQYRVDALRASYDLARLNYDYTAIRATIDGVVSSRNVKLGSNLEIDQVAFRVTNTERLVAYLNIPQTDLHRFTAGDDAVLSVDAAPGQRFIASVARLSPTIDMTTGTFRATLYIDNSANALAPGMFGRFAIEYDRHSDALVIPVAAIVREDNESVVYVVKNGSAVRRPIQTGIEADGIIEVIEGLSAQETVVLSGQSQLRDGSRVLASAGTGTTDLTG